MMITLGVDAHKATHTIVAVDPNGKQLSTTTVQATPGGHLTVLRWASKFPSRCWAIEDCRPVTRRLEKDLLSVGETAVRVPPKLMAQARSSVRTPGKSDPIDALAIARAALRHDDLPRACLDGNERIGRLLTEQREALVAERTRLVNRLRWRLHELDPTLRPPTAAFNRTKHVTAITQQAKGWSQSFDPITACQSQIAVTELQRIRDLNSQIISYDQQIIPLVAATCPQLLTIVGIGPVTAAAILGHIGNIDRFRTENKFAALVGTAPIPVSSGNHNRMRLNPGGDRYLNSVIHRIAITQLAHHQPAKTLVTSAMARGKTKREAIRILKRHITRAIYKTLQHDQQHQQQAAA